MNVTLTDEQIKNISAYVALRFCSDIATDESLRLAEQAIRTAISEMERLASDTLTDSVCPRCNKSTQSVAGDPGMWPVGLHYNGNGKSVIYHQRCVSETFLELEASRERVKNLEDWLALAHKEKDCFIKSFELAAKNLRREMAATAKDAQCFRDLQKRQPELIADQINALEQDASPVRPAAELIADLNKMAGTTGTADAWVAPPDAVLMPRVAPVSLNSKALDGDFFQVLFDLCRDDDYAGLYRAFVAHYALPPARTAMEVLMPSAPPSPTLARNEFDADLFDLCRADDYAGLYRAFVRRYGRSPK